MLGIVAKYIQEVSVLRRLLFAVVFLNPEMPMFWGVVVEFATAGKLSKKAITSDEAKMLVENIQAMNAAAFETDQALQKELIFLSLPGKKPLGIPLISPSSSCLLCGSELQLRKDRPAPIIIYDSKCGTIPGAHYHKFAQKGRAHSLSTTVITLPKAKLSSMRIGVPYNTSYIIPRYCLFPRYSEMS